LNTTKIPPLPAGAPDDPVTAVVEKLNAAAHAVPLAHLIPALCRLLALTCLHARDAEAVIKQVPHAIAGHFALAQKAVAHLRGVRVQ
jgi:hypothetical protein